MKAISLPLLLLASIFLLANFCSASRGHGPMPGGWSKIKNMSDPHVAEIGEFAVSEHNKETNSKLAFIKVIKGKTQVVAGLNYKLVLKAKDGDRVGRYEAVIWEVVWENILKLTSFKTL